MSNTLNTAISVGALSGAFTQTYSQRLQPTAPLHYYRLSLTSASRLSLSLGGLQANADLRLLNSQGSVIGRSLNSGTTSELITQELAVGTYFVQVNTAATHLTTNYSLGIVTSDWFSRNLRDAGLVSVARSLTADRTLDRADWISLFSNAGDGAQVDGNELEDLRKLVTIGSDRPFSLAEPVRNLAEKVVYSHVANAYWQGKSSFGNLFAGSSQVHLERLVDKWFRGRDRPDAVNEYGVRYSYQSANGQLFVNGASFQDIKQGYLGNCYFLAGLANAALRSPSTITNMFTDNGDGTFIVKFIRNGKADYVTVDRTLPVDQWGRFIFAGSGNYANQTSNELWVALAEKAYAQMSEAGGLRGPMSAQVGRNAYANIVVGFSHGALTDITGLTVRVDNLDQWDANAIVTAWNNRQMVFVNSRSQPTSSTIVAGHAYVLVDYNSTTQRFKLFNPWGVNGASNSQGWKPGYVELTIAELVANFQQWGSA